MKILRIAGRNLASLAVEFAVDFQSEPLASTGLFAICGPTGAGKSTLLDALCLALYDDTPRLVRANRSQLQDVGANLVSSQDPRSLLRRGAGEGHAEVDFVGSDGVAYRARWSVRRAHNKASGTLQASMMTLHRLPEMQRIGGTKTEAAAEIVARIGLTFDQFTRAVLLAQNEFSAFLKTDDNERGELLETLTGSAVYSELSRRAYARHRLEQEALARLTARLADQTPLSPEERAQVQQDSVAANAALAAIDVRRLECEAQLRWHQEAERLDAQVEAAAQALAASEAAVQAAGERRARLASLDALQPARPLLAEAARLAAEAAAIRQAETGAAQALEQANQARAGGAGALAEAQHHVTVAEEAQRAAAPLIDQAKALDTSLGALAEPHAQARQAAQAAGAEAAQAQATLDAAQAVLARSQADLQAVRAWLEQHGQWQALAAQWPRWDALLAQGEAASAHGAALDAALQRARAALDAAHQADAAGAQALDQTARTLEERDGARRQAATALAEFDLDALAREGEQLQRERDALASAQLIVQGLTTARTRLAEIDAQLASLHTAAAAANAALAASAAAQPALQAAQAQAERSLGAAELACAASVVDLRQRLEPDHPCPVCGSAEHPYHQQSALLDDMLASLKQEVARCRAALQDNLAQQAAQGALAARSSEQLASLARERQASTDALEQASLQWNRHPLASAAPHADHGAWLRELAEANGAARNRHAAQEQAARRASATRDACQQAYDQTASMQAAAQQRLQAARDALAQAGAEHAALQSKAAQAGDALRALLGQLDEALDWQPDWRDSWHADPAGLRAALARHAGRWRDQAERARQLEAGLGALEAQLQAAQTDQQRCARKAEASAADFAQFDTRLVHLRAQRQALWEGRAVQDVERELHDAMTAARATLASRQDALQQLAVAESRAREALDQTRQRAGAIDEALQEAAARIDHWLLEHAEAHPGSATPAHRADLERLLALDTTELAREREAMQALDAAVTEAHTVLRERRRQLAAHLGERTRDAAAQAQAAQALETVLEERAGVDGTAAALRLQLARDDERRERAREVLAEIEAQQLVERRWARMSDLIGSADGKKFRNYAQQFTLDVLLGYANRHLAQLARRYRLERVLNAGGPSLALMVRDADMGGEIRSVNSLSGGESFLVSLALALGLASLSSNRVRVESLFIDEGFGSLDSDTLRVAMEALDALQSMGRKVGVISHVQEMTERIATRVLVQPAGMGASTVTVQ